LEEVGVSVPSKDSESYPETAYKNMREGMEGGSESFTLHIQPEKKRRGEFSKRSFHLRGNPGVKREENHSIKKKEERL